MNIMWLAYLFASRDTVSTWSRIMLSREWHCRNKHPVVGLRFIRLSNEWIAFSQCVSKTVFYQLNLPLVEHMCKAFTFFLWSRLHGVLFLTENWFVMSRWDYAQSEQTCFDVANHPFLFCFSTHTVFCSKLTKPYVRLNFTYWHSDSQGIRGFSSSGAPDGRRPITKIFLECDHLCCTTDCMNYQIHSLRSLCASLLTVLPVTWNSTGLQG